MSIENGCPNPDCHDPDCDGGSHPQIHALSLSDLLGLNRKPVKTKDLGVLATEEVSAFNEMRNTFIKAQETLAKAEELKKRFWAMTRLNHNLFSKEYDNLHVNEKTGMLSCDVEEE